MARTKKVGVHKYKISSHPSSSLWICYYSLPTTIFSSILRKSQAPTLQKWGAVTSLYSPWSRHCSLPTSTYQSKVSLIQGCGKHYRRGWDIDCGAPWQGFWRWDWALLLGGKAYNETINHFAYWRGLILRQFLIVDQLGVRGMLHGKFWYLDLLKSPKARIFSTYFCIFKAFKEGNQATWKGALCPRLLNKTMSIILFKYDSMYEIERLHRT